MYHKYLYLFLKDGHFRAVFILSVVGAVFCFVALRLNIEQGVALKDANEKQDIIAQIPALQAKIVQMERMKKLKAIGNRLTISGIISSEIEPMVIINNRIIKVGDVVEGKKVVTITAHAATLCDAQFIKCNMLFVGK